MKEVRECPICDWKHETERPQVPAGALASVFGPGVMSAVAMQQHAWDIERALDAHFRTHSTVDWVKATVALRARVAELEATVARYRQYEYVEARHDETGRSWFGARYNIPERFHEVSNESGVPGPTARDAGNKSLQRIEGE